MEALALAIFCAWFQKASKPLAALGLWRQKRSQTALPRCALCIREVLHGVLLASGCCICSSCLVLPVTVTRVLVFILFQEKATCCYCWFSGRCSSSSSSLRCLGGLHRGGLSLGGSSRNCFNSARLVELYTRGEERWGREEMR